MHLYQHLALPTWVKKYIQRINIWNHITEEHLQLILMIGNTKFGPQLSKMFLKKNYIFSKVDLYYIKLYSIFITFWISSIKNCGNLVPVLSCKCLYNVLDFALWPMILKYLLSSTLQKKIADLCSRTNDKKIRHLKVDNIFNKLGNSV